MVNNPPSHGGSRTSVPIPSPHDIEAQFFSLRVSLTLSNAPSVKSVTPTLYRISYDGYTPYPLFDLLQIM